MYFISLIKRYIYLSDLRKIWFNINNCCSRNPEQIIYSSARFLQNITKGYTKGIGYYKRYITKGFVNFFFVLFTHSYHFFTTIHIVRIFLGVNFFSFFCLCFNINCLSFVPSFRAFCSKGSQSKLSSIPFRYQLRLFFLSNQFKVSAPFTCLLLFYTCLLLSFVFLMISNVYN